MTLRSAHLPGLHRFRVALLASLMLASLLPGSVVLAAASVTTAATASISVDTASPGGSGVYTPLTGMRRCS